MIKKTYIKKWFSKRDLLVCVRIDVGVGLEVLSMVRKVVYEFDPRRGPQMVNVLDMIYVNVNGLVDVDEKSVKKYFQLVDKIHENMSGYAVYDLANGEVRIIDEGNHVIRTYPDGSVISIRVNFKNEKDLINKLYIFKHVLGLYMGKRIDEIIDNIEKYKKARSLSLDVIEYGGVLFEYMDVRDVMKYPKVKKVGKVHKLIPVFDRWGHITGFSRCGELISLENLYDTTSNLELLGELADFLEKHKDLIGPQHEGYVDAFIQHVRRAQERAKSLKIQACINNKQEDGK